MKIPAELRRFKIRR